MKKLKIGITQRVEVVKDYGEIRDCLDQAWVQLLEQLNFEVLPIPNQLANPISWVENNGIDGLILSGGNDLGSFPDAKNVSQARDALEKNLLLWSMNTKTPVLGVCRGMQMINATLGGQHIKVTGHVANEHELEGVDKSSDLMKYKTVNSFHEWGMTRETISSELLELARSNDGCIEAVKHRTLPWLGVMWHPERNDVVDNDKVLIRNHFNSHVNRSKSMRVVVLAAGQGSRLRPLTDNKPKCMVELLGKSLLHYQIELLEKNSINDIVVVGGYLNENLDTKGHKLVINPRYAETNMVSTLFCADEFIDDGQDLLITYGDIVYDEEVLKAVLADNSPVAVVIDKNWKLLWSLRMDDPLSDAETLKLDQANKIKEIGRKPKSYSEIEGQYIGIIKIRADKVNEFKRMWNELDKNIILDGKNLDNIFMTSFLQYMIDKGIDINAIFIKNGWLEIDTVADLGAYEKFIVDGKHKHIFRGIAKEHAKNTE